MDKDKIITDLDRRRIIKRAVEKAKKAANGNKALAVQLLFEAARTDFELREAITRPVLRARIKELLAEDTLRD